MNKNILKPRTFTLKEMVTKSGQFKTSLPTQYRTKKGQKKSLISIDNDELRRCPNCSKRKMLVKHNYKKDDEFYKYSRCGNCEYTNYIPINKENDNSLVCKSCESIIFLASDEPDLKKGNVYFCDRRCFTAFIRQNKNEIIR